ncbi:MAG: hypothetical protein U0795_26420 [Pirellulales bacterium]
MSRQNDMPPPTVHFTVPIGVRQQQDTVGNAGNDAESTGLGAVSNVYRISQHEVNVAQYTEFLNASDPTSSISRALCNSLV